MSGAGTPESGFARSWTAEVLAAAPLIEPVRAFVYPQQIPGEEDAMGRGAMRIRVRPRLGGEYLATCALGFRDAAMPSGVHACPHPDHLCALAGGYAYLADTTRPETCTLLPLRPVTEVRAAPEQGLLLFLGFHTVLAWDVSGIAWETARLTWEGLRVTEVTATHLYGLGWDLRSDREVPFAVELASGRHTGGASPGSGS